MDLQLRPTLFWDTDVATIDLNKHRAFVIERVTSRGQLEEFQAILDYYKKEIVRDTLLNTRYLDKKTLAFCSAIFHVPKSEFRCYKLAQLNEEHWNY